MEHKFKKGQCIRYIGRTEIFKVIDVVEGMTIYNGNWGHGDDFAIIYSDSYVVEKCDSKMLYYVRLTAEHEWEYVQALDGCPRCNRRLVQIESESIFGMKYQGHKCNACGYCA
jgi:hypothetical protein